MEDGVEEGVEDEMGGRGLMMGWGAKDGVEEGRWRRMRWWRE